MLATQTTGNAMKSYQHLTETFYNQRIETMPDTTLREMAEFVSPSDLNAGQTHRIDSIRTAVMSEISARAEEKRHKDMLQLQREQLAESARQHDTAQIAQDVQHSATLKLMGEQRDDARVDAGIARRSNRIATAISVVSVIGTLFAAWEAHHQAEDAATVREEITLLRSQNADASKRLFALEHPSKSP